MSLKTTVVTEDIDNYLSEYFSSEDDFLRNLNLEAKNLEMPTISISPSQGAFLQFFLKSINAKYVLEIGSLAGYSAITMARALPSDGKLIAVEINSRYADLIKQNVKKANLSDIIEVVNSNAIDFFQSFKPDFKFDFAFIDADKKSYIDYFKLIEPLIKIGGVIAADNALAHGLIAQDNPEQREENVKYIKEFNLFLANNPNYKSCLIPLGDGMAMGVKLM